MAFAALKVDALLSPGTLFHILAIMFEVRLGNPGTGGRISFEDCDLVDLKLGLSWKRYCPSGFIQFLDF